MKEVWINMKYELFDFQKEAVNNLLKKMDSMQRTYAEDGSLSAVSLTAPTGAGKTVISAAVAEGLFYGNDVFAGDDSAVILWLSDSPSLNEQTMKRFDAATDLLNGTTDMIAIGPDFAKNHRKLMPGHVYFLNRQLLGKRKKLSNEAEGGRSFYDVLNDTIEDNDIHLYLFIDEAHRGLGTGKDKGTSDNANKTIYSIIIDGQEGINKPMPCVVGISATPERFNNAMQGRKNRDMKAGIDVPVSEVRASGLIKDMIELRTPKETADTRHQDLTQACVKLAESSRQWNKYCSDNNISPTVIPLMVVQVEDKVSKDTLTSLCSQISKKLPWLDITDCFANVFGEHEDINTSICKIPYIKPDEITDHTNIRVLFAKDAVSTGWDCPRAEVIYSRRKRKDPTYIAQLIGRMIRTPLARRVETFEELNTVSCYLPEFNADTVDSVVEKLKEDNVAVETTKVIKNPADVSFFGKNKEKVEKKLEKKKSSRSKLSGIQKQTPLSTTKGPEKLTQQEPEKEQTSTPDNNTPQPNTQEQTPLSTTKVPEKPTQQEPEKEQTPRFDDEFQVVLDDNLNDIDDNIKETEEELKEALNRIPKVDAKEIKESFESIITRQVRHDKPDHFLDLWDCVDIILADLNQDAEIGSSLEDDFYNNIEGEIKKHPAMFNRALNDIKSTTVYVKRVDPLTGKVFEDREELVENDSVRLTSYYKHAVTIFSGASDLVKYYIKKRIDEEYDSETEAISRIAAVGYCIEIVHAMEQWAEDKTDYLLDRYGPMRYEVSEDNRAKWDRIEGNTKPYIERSLSIQASIRRQNKEYDKYPKHIISDEDGWAYLKLNDLEKKVVETELDKPTTVAFYRNQSRNLNASLSIPYELNGEWENMYPDFIFFVKTENGISRVIVDPHGDWLGDSVAKLKGYVSYIKNYPDMFNQVLVVADEKGGEYRYLDLMLEPVQYKIEQFNGSSAKELFTGPSSRKYHIKND